VLRTPRNKLDWVDPKDGGVILIIGMKMTHMVPLRWLNEHSNNNAVEPTGGVNDFD
jgi:hypothetical protein